MKTLFYGPWIGEFGWEIMGAGMARALAGSNGYQKVVVCSRPASAALYADFATEFVAHDIQCTGVVATANPQPDTSTVLRWVRMDAETTHELPRAWRPGVPTRFVKYGKARPEWAGAVVLHARARAYTPARNWPVANWHRLARWLLRGGVTERLVCVGTPSDALTVEGACDARQESLAVQMDILASARYAIGPSSGPMHLASHSGCPHVVWCGGGPDERRHTRTLYEGPWNPHGTKVAAYEYASWQPEFGTVKGWVENFLKEV